MVQILPNSYWGLAAQFVFIHILIIVSVGAILFWIIHKFIRDLRLSNLLKILVVLLCLVGILQRLLALFGTAL
jgi:hypothetical protein